MTRKLKFLVTVPIILALFGCAGKTVRIHESLLPVSEKDYRIKKDEVITFSISTKGIQRYSGLPKSIGFKIYSVSLDLKRIQEVAAHKVLRNIYQDVFEAGDRSTIISYITDFKYEWPAGFTTKAVVSFKLHISTFDNGKEVASEIIKVEKFEGNEGKFFMWGAVGILVGMSAVWTEYPPGKRSFPLEVGGMVFGAMLFDSLSGDANKRSQMVSNATLEAVYKAYEEKLPQLIEMLSK